LEECENVQRTVFVVGIDRYKVFPEQACGDGIVAPSLGEEWDDGNIDSLV
jgi:hypothetical protein